MMIKRSLFLALLLTLPSLAFAQSRVVGDTFREQRESHVQSSTETLQNYQEDGAVMLKERAAAAEDVDTERETRRQETEESKKQWFEEWTDDGGERAAKKEAVDEEREARRTASIAAPSEWWDDGPEITASDYDDLNQ